MAFVLDVIVADADIDELSHASNLAYLKWVQDAAWAHSTALGLGLSEYRGMGRVFVVRRHVIEYLRPAFRGEEIAVETRVTVIAAASSERQTEIRRDGVVLARAITTWAFVDAARGRPVRIPEDVRARFPVDPPFTV